MATWQNRIVGTGEEPPDQLLANPLNWRTHPRHQQDAMTAALADIGWIQSVIVNRTTGRMIDGHLRVSLALRRGEPTIPVTYVELSDAEEALALATFDPISALAVADKAQLDALLRDVSTGEAALQEMLSDLAEREGILDAGSPADGLTDPDDVPDSPADPISRPGDIWLLGDHRVVCGDATSEQSWDALDIGQRAMVFTSPPYGVGVNARIHEHYVPGAKTRDSLYADHDDDPDNWPSLMGGFTRIALNRAECVVVNVQTLANNKRAFVNWLAEFAPHLVDVAVWDKGHGPPQMQRNVLNNAFEWLVALAPSTNPSRAMPLADFHGTVGNVIRLSGQRDNDIADIHAATMPAELADWAIGNLGAKADVIVDPFAGTGTTLIAAEHRGVRAAMIELSPLYVDVIVRRWEAFTGRTAERLRDGDR